MESEIKLFSKFFENKREKDNLFSRESLISAYLVGAFASAIIKYSFEGVKNRNGELISFVKENETFKKWLSNQQITQKNLLRIFNKASHFQRKFNLDNLIIRDLSTLVTDYLKVENSKGVSNQEVSFAFLRGFNDFIKFKYSKKGDI